MILVRQRAGLPEISSSPCVISNDTLETNILDTLVIIMTKCSKNVKVSVFMVQLQSLIIFPKSTVTCSCSQATVGAALFILF